MPSRQAQLQEDTAYRVMRLLEHNPDLTQRELAQHLGVGVSVGGLNLRLNAQTKRS
jgi:hypothetical protein